jgi:hypothetical protein
LAVVRLFRTRRSQTAVDAPEWEPLDASYGDELAAIEFPVTLRDTVGGTLRLVRPGPSPGYERADGSWRPPRFLGREFWLVAGELSVAYLRYGDRDDPALVEMACREERWQLTEHRRTGWDLSLERTTDHAPLGGYRGRRWRAGGTIELADGTSITVQNWPGGPWRLQTRGAKPFAEVRRGLVTRSRRDEPLRVTMKSAPLEIVGLHLVVLSVCGVMLLEDDSMRMSQVGGA